jgi:RHS repeat-associated protein
MRQFAVGGNGYDWAANMTTEQFSTPSGPASLGYTVNLAWGYDRYGNRISQSATGSYTGSVSQPTFAIDPTSNRITSSGYVYDAAGNLRSDGINTYTYDAEGNVVAISGGTSASMSYDAFNQRVLATTNGTTLAYGFNAAGQRATVWDGSGNLLSAQYYVGSQPLAYWLASDGHVRFQHQDWVGTERLRTSYNGSVEGSYTSLPFGDGLTASGSDTDAYHYVRQDSDTADLQHATYREFSSVQGRWFRPDPDDGSYDITDPQSLNRYSYAGNSPTVLTDPSGLTTYIPRAGCINASM